MEKKQISVVIPVKNQREKIGNCLQAIFNQSHQPYEVIVVDGHSEDGTIENAREFPVVIIYEDYHTRSGACQEGIKYASGDYIAFTDADCIPDENWLANLVEELNDNIVGVGGAVQKLGNSFWVHSTNLAYSTFLGSAKSVQGRVFKERRFVNSISGCNSMYRRSDLLKIGGFKTSLPGAEDAELNSRLQKLGKLLYLPSAIIYHDDNRGLKEFARLSYRYGRDRGVARKLGLTVVPALLFPLLLLSLILNRWILPAFLILYTLIIIAMGLMIAVKEKNIRLLFSIPFVYIVEHSLYSLGFWKGLMLRR